MSSASKTDKEIEENCLDSIADSLNKLALDPQQHPTSGKKSNNDAKIQDVIDLIYNSKKIIIVTGAGISVSCGIPDFRSSGGVYAQLRKTHPKLTNPTDMFNIQYFRKDPTAFFDFAQKLWPGNFEPSKTHKFMAKLDKEGKLLRNYTQNIDTLEQVAGMKNVIQCHGSFEKATCQNYDCEKIYLAEDIKEKVFNKEIPYCGDCPEGTWDGKNHSRNGQKTEKPVIKPNIVFFGESLPMDFHRNAPTDTRNCDLCIVIGSSMMVSPVNCIPDMIPEDVPKILINKEELQHSYTKYNYELYGYCDKIVECLESGQGSHSCGNGQGNGQGNGSDELADDFKMADSLDDFVKNEKSKKYFVKGNKFVFEGADASYILT